MWIFSAIGFFSVEIHPDHPEAVLIRAAVREDLEELQSRYLPDIEIVEEDAGDHRWGACVWRDEWEHAAQGLAADLDYSDVREVVAERQGGEREARYRELWRAMQRLQSATTGSSSRSTPAE